MKSISYDIDPGGDIELILKNPNEQNVVPDSPDYPDIEAINYHKFANPPCLGRYQVFSELYSNDQDEAPDEVQVRMRVSSRHLILTSRTFRAMLEGPWREAASSSQPIRQISAESWDAFALAIVLDSIHGRHRGIPTEINIGSLTRIATIVDYYQCGEAMHFNYPVWAHSKALPLGLCNVTLMWLYVSWVFHDEDRFRTTACSFLRFSTGMHNVKTQDLPICGILSKLDGLRQTLFPRILGALASLQEVLIEERGCEQDGDSDCTAIMLGILMREKRDIDQRIPLLVSPFTGCSLSLALCLINEFEIPMAPHSEGAEDPYNQHDSKGHHPCTIQGRLVPILDEINKAIEGVSLADFQSSDFDENLAYGNLRLR